MSDTTCIDAFFAKIKQDSPFRKALADSANDEQLLEVIQKAGFSVTAAELIEAMASWTNAAFGGSELSDDQLSAVAGGSVSVFMPVGGASLKSSLFSLTKSIGFKGTTGI